MNMIIKYLLLMEFIINDWLRALFFPPLEESNFVFLMYTDYKFRSTIDLYIIYINYIFTNEKYQNLWTFVLSHARLIMFSYDFYIEDNTSGKSKFRMKFVHVKHMIINNCHLFQCHLSLMHGSLFLNKTFIN